MLNIHKALCSILASQQEKCFLFGRQRQVDLTYIVNSRRARYRKSCLKNDNNSKQTNPPKQQEHPKKHKGPNSRFVSYLLKEAAE